MVEIRSYGVRGGNIWPRYWYAENTVMEFVSLIEGSTELGLMATFPARSMYPAFPCLINLYESAFLVRS